MYIKRKITGSVELQNSSWASIRNFEVFDQALSILWLRMKIEGVEKKKSLIFEKFTWQIGDMPDTLCQAHPRVRRTLMFNSSKKKEKSRFFLVHKNESNEQFVIIQDAFCFAHQKVQIPGLSENHCT